MADKGQTIAPKAAEMYYINTEFGYAKSDTKGWITHTAEKSDALIFTDVLDGGDPNKLYIMCMADSFAGWYLSSDWNKGMGLYEHWIDAAYWEWQPAADAKFSLEIKSFESKGHHMSYRDSNGYFYTYDSYPHAHITKEKYEAPQRKDLPRTIRTFEKIQIGNEPYYMNTQFGYVSLDYKGTLTHVGSKLEATIFKDFTGSGAGKVHIVITNGQYADCIVSTYANGVMMVKNTKETKAEFQFTKQDNALVLTASSGSNGGNKMALKKDTGFFYANNVYEVAMITKVLYNPAVDEPKNLPK